MREDINLETFRKRLEERQKIILAGKEAQKKEHTTVELDHARVGRLTRMDAMQQQAMVQAAARLTDVERQRIQTALSRIQSGEYGYCILCDEEIAEKRLEFDPSLLTCISCAKNAEKH
ncbi:MAG: TraR/DksA C4-type zinc finger protein [Proteobacteria bacterium]|nr:TraR/DksA C4-type zinc finger protein [Pseudomonadota bacterium]MBU1419342.1 TraR/DksA C4-type zinc finger protein [Pseudomonadota bacterium]MBU1453909.1 TraR/DksA C4-type zinc finger protein [Pseudomonadota bacterium]